MSNLLRRLSLRLAVILSSPIVFACQPLSAPRDQPAADAVPLLTLDLTDQPQSMATPAAVALSTTAGGLTRGLTTGQHVAVPSRHPVTNQIFYVAVYVPPGVPMPQGAVPMSMAFPTSAIEPRVSTISNTPRLGVSSQLDPFSPPNGVDVMSNSNSNFGAQMPAPAASPALRVLGQSERTMAAIQDNSLQVSRSTYPKFLAPGADFKIGPEELKASGTTLCVLTFDDGPHPELDPAILDILRLKRVPATFFYLGELIERNAEIVRRAAMEGHEIGQHSFDHQDLSSLSARQIEAQFQRVTAALAAIGVQARVFRPPYGSYSGELVQIAANQGMVTVNWTNDSQDWKLRDPVEITDHIMANAAPGDVILMHSIHRATVAALPTLIDRLRQKGCQFTTVSRWLQFVT